MVKNYFCNWDPTGHSRILFNLLSNCEPENSFILDLEVKRNLHQHRMLHEPEDSFENLDEGIFNQTYDRLRK